MRIHLPSLIQIFIILILLYCSTLLYLIPKHHACQHINSTAKYTCQVYTVHTWYYQHAVTYNHYKESHKTNRPHSHLSFFPLTCTRPHLITHFRGFSLQFVLFNPHIYILLNSTLIKEVLRSSAKSVFTSMITPSHNTEEQNLHIQTWILHF